MDGRSGAFGRGLGECGREGRAGEEVHKEGRVTWRGQKQQGGRTLDLWSFGEGRTPKCGGEIVDAAGKGVQKDGRTACRRHEGQWERTVYIWEFRRVQDAELGTSNAR